ncbi:Aluminum-activated malate transporter 7 [Hibiscus syriacus]|uniref:Aluminum-activated malate transporter 7 n=1 Tax=Hibiscus syriacus TaxID=106335 RepID=A0A6A2XGK1_HIBSY|nr:Aluminum-activated malate transporter 7 [Hibiscus syriacus]
MNKQAEEKEILDVFQNVEINIPLLEVIRKVPRYVWFLKDLCTIKRKISGVEKVNLGEHVSTVFQQKLPPKLKDQACRQIYDLSGRTLGKYAGGGFFQIPVAPEDQEKTTFTCPFGTFDYRRMPFGLCNAPATFQRWATLGKGVNRGLATLLAGALAVGAHQLAKTSGRIYEPVVLGFFVFLQGITCKLCASEVLIVFTHNLCTYVQLRVCEILPKIKAKYDYGLFIFIWTFSLISISGFRDDEILELVHKRLLTVLIGGSTCVNIISVLLFPVWAGQDLPNLIASNMEKLDIILEGTIDAVQTMVKPTAAYIHIEKSKSNVKNLNSLLKSGLCDDKKDILEVLPLATVASLLIDVVSCTSKIADSVNELAAKLNFEAVEPTVSPDTQLEI